MQIGDETDIDCGGPNCEPCEDGLRCAGAEDCFSGVCEANICQAPTCEDGVQNGNEIDVDCGQPDCNACAFVSLWQSDLSGDSNNNQIALPLVPDGIYDFTVDWGDDTQDSITSWDQPETTHTYTSAGTYTVTIHGTIEGWAFQNAGDPEKLVQISSWGPLKWGNSGVYFSGAQNLEITATDIPDLEGTTNLDRAFSQCASLITVPSMNDWDMSEVTNMSRMFWEASAFNQDIGDWDTSQVTTMLLLFADATAFDQDIGAWNTSQVTDMSELFSNATAFNQDIGDWDTSQVTDMSELFSNATAFNQYIGAWNTSQVTTMRSMFKNAASFNQNIDGWDTSQVTDMSEMFWEASVFNQNIGDWDTSQVIDMSEMFASTDAFNQDLSNWDTSRVYDMSWMFSNAAAFDQDIGDWLIYNIFDFRLMFSGVTLSTANYDALLNGWAMQPLFDFVDFDAGNSQYSQDGADAREFIINNHGWSISDGGQVF